jgi:hypothetical protein
MIFALAIVHILDDMGMRAQMGGDQILWSLGKYTAAVFPFALAACRYTNGAG